MAASPCVSVVNGQVYEQSVGPYPYTLGQSVDIWYWPPKPTICTVKIPQVAAPVALKHAVLGGFILGTGYTLAVYNRTRTANSLRT